MNDGATSASGAVSTTPAPPAPAATDTPRVTVTFPGAQRPERTYRVDAYGVGIAVYEWGDADAPVLFVVHGGFDFAGTYDVFAPKLAAGGWRVVAWDHRGHGDSDHVPLYSWNGDLRDAAVVMSAATTRPAPVIAHSKGGAMMLQLADAEPFRFTHVVNIDGIPFRSAAPDIAGHERSRMLQADIERWLDFRRTSHLSSRKPATFEGLAERRQKMNPRLSIEWLRYLVSVGAFESDDGWRWKIDPAMRFGGFGPWRPEWSLERLPGIGVPFLGLLGMMPEEMGWQLRASDVESMLPEGGRIIEFADSGHFIHIEQPDVVAGIVLDFVSR